MTWSVDDASTFGVVDYVIFVLVFVLSLAVGLYRARGTGKDDTTSEFLMGGRSMGLYPITLSLCVSVVSATTLLGAPAEVYQYGIQYALLPISLITATVINVFCFIPLFYPLRLTSIHEVCLPPHCMHVSTVYILIIKNTVS